MRILAGWASALRIARREARRARGRSVLVLVMILTAALAALLLRRGLRLTRLDGILLTLAYASVMPLLLAA